MQLGDSSFGVGGLPRQFSKRGKKLTQVQVAQLNGVTRDISQNSPSLLERTISGKQTENLADNRQSSSGQVSLVVG